MARFRGFDEMEESWQDVAPVRPNDNVLDTGEQAYLRTQQVLAEAQVVGNILFDDGRGGGQEAGGIGSYTRADRRDDDGERETKSQELSSSIFDRMLAPGGVGKGLGVDAAARRPEEISFCDAFLELQEMMRSLTPGARVQPFDMEPILAKLLDCTEMAQKAEASAMARLRELQGDGSPAVAMAAATSHELSLEVDTWSLLLKLNIAEEEDKAIAEAEEDTANNNGDGDRRTLPPAANPNDSDDVAMEAMWHRDELFRRTTSVVQWLQEAAEGKLETRAPSAFVTCGGHKIGWGLTLESLAAGAGQKNSEVAQMHPDASLKKTAGGGGGSVGWGWSREEGKEEEKGGGAGAAAAALKVVRLVGQDDLDEEELLRTMWMLVRAGRVKAAKDLCLDRGQPWRAAAMAGGGVVGSEEDGYPVEDGAVFSPGQGLWQEMCWQLSVSLEKGADHSEGPARSVAMHEAAVFAHLAGNTELLLSSDLTQSWEDQAWVRFCSLLHRNILVERTRQRRMQASLSSLFPGVNTLPTDEQLLQRMERGSPPSSHEAIFEMLDGSAQSRIRAEGQGMYRQAQQALILGESNIPLFLENILRRVVDPGAMGVEEDQRRQEATAGQGMSQPALPAFRSAQLLRFAAHLALILGAQCPYLTMADGTQEAIDDVVCAYAEHLGKTQQVTLVAVYAATLPVSRRRELYARFLRSVEGEASRTQALEEARKHMGSDVSAILKMVVEHARLEIPSIAPRVPRQVPDGDLKKIHALSWLLGQEDTRSEAVLQANALARHFVLQQYQESVIGQHNNHNHSGLGLGLIVTSASTAALGSGVIAGAGLLPWERSRASSGIEAGGDKDSKAKNASRYDDGESPVILSARVEAVEMLLDTVPIACCSRDQQQQQQQGIEEGKEDGGGGALGVEAAAAAEAEAEAVYVSADAVREQECWLLLIAARKAYAEWLSTRRAREQGAAAAAAAAAGGGGRRGGSMEEDDKGWAMVEMNEADSTQDEHAAAVHEAAEKAIAAAERVLMFEDGWMYPQEEDVSSSTPRTPSEPTLSSNPAWRNPMDSRGPDEVNRGALVIAGTAGGGGGDVSGEGMIIEYPLAAEADSEARQEEKRKERQIAEARELRTRRELERVAMSKESAVRLGRDARRQELLAVRASCLPGLVFLFHEVVHGTGLWMFKWSKVESARSWFVRGQTMANVVSNDVHRLAEAMSKRQMCRLLRCIERSSTQILLCDERINNVEAFLDGGGGY